MVFVYFFIECDGVIIQFVFCYDCVWYVGVFCFDGCEVCNDFFFGIELEGIDMELYMDVQYIVLVGLMWLLCVVFLGIILECIQGYCDIVLECKIDFGEVFDWLCYCVGLIDFKEEI